MSDQHRKPKELAKLSKEVAELQRVNDIRRRENEQMRLRLMRIEDQLLELQRTIPAEASCGAAEYPVLEAEV